MWYSGNMLAMDSTRGKGCGCLLLVLFAIGIGGCVIIMHLRAGADVAAVKGEPPDVTKAVIESMAVRVTNQAEQEVRP